MIHVVFSNSAAGTIKYGIQEAKKIIHFNDNLSEGPIGLNLDYNLRNLWFNNTIFKDIDFTEEEISKDYKSFHKNVEEIKDTDTVYIWVGNNSLEQCALMYFLSIVNINANIHVINVSNVTFNKGETYEFTPKGVGEIEVDKLHMYLGTAKKLSKEDIECHIEIWRNLINENSNLRVFKAGKIISVPEDFYDNEILNYTTEFSMDGFRKCARVIGHIMGISEDLVNDYYLFWRVKELVKQGKISGRGSYKSIRDLEIK